MIENVAGLSESELRVIEALVEGHKTLEEVTKWALSQKPLRLFTHARGAGVSGEVQAKGPGFDVFVQDEYTHDVVVPYDVDGKVFLVYDTT